MNVVVLCGGVGGAKFAEGLVHTLNANQLTIIGNTGDDFVHFGLHICPDLDTVMYRLANKVDREKGWGRKNESWHTLEEVKRLQGPAWFQLGDRDLAVHLLRTHQLNAGDSLTQITHRLSHHFAIGCTLLPMSDHLVQTKIQTPNGVLDFQEWFVGKQWQPKVTQVLLPKNQETTPQVLAALDTADLILIAPSNPFVSIDPILNINPILAKITQYRAKTIAISPLVGDNAVKGPVAKMMRDQGKEINAQTILEHYHPIISGFVQDERDAQPVSAKNVDVFVTDSLMKTIDDEKRFAEKVLLFHQKNLS